MFNVQSPKNCQQVPADGAQMPPQAGSTTAPRGVQIVHLLVSTHHMGSHSLYILQRTTLGAYQIAVAHQYDVATVKKYNPVHHISAVICPSQHNIANLQLIGLLQNHALLTTDDKRQHAIAINGQRNADALIHQSDGLFDNIAIALHLFTFLPFYYFTIA